MVIHFTVSNYLKQFPYINSVFKLEYFYYSICIIIGKRRVKLEIRTNGQIGNNNSTDKGAKRKRVSGLEKKLDELRTEISSQHGGIFPHSVLSLQHISMLSTQKPTSLEEVITVNG